MNALSAADWGKAEKLMRRGANVNAALKFDGATCLMYAAKRGNAQAASLLIRNGADVNAVDINGKTALIWAIEHGEDEIVPVLLRNGADPNLEAPCTDCALLLAIRSERKELVRLLLERGASPNVATKSEGCFYEGVTGVHMTRVALEHGDTALVIALKQDNFRLAEFLLDRGADLNRGRAPGWEPILCMMDFNHSKAVMWLIDHGARLDVQREGRSALAMAMELSDPTEVVNCLLNKGLDPSVRDPKGHTVLMLAASGGKEALVDILLARGVDPNARNDSGDTAISLSIENFKVDAWTSRIVKSLLSHGADAKVLDIGGRSLVESALASCLWATAEVLISYGGFLPADPAVSHSAMFGAAKDGAWGLVEALINRGMPKDSMDEKGHSLLDIAKQRGQIARCLIATGIDSKDALLRQAEIMRQQEQDRQACEREERTKEEARWAALEPGQQLVELRDAVDYYAERAVDQHAVGDQLRLERAREKLAEFLSKHPVYQTQ